MSRCPEKKRAIILIRRENAETDTAAEGHRGDQRKEGHSIKEERSRLRILSMAQQTLKIVPTVIHEVDVFMETSRTSLLTDRGTGTLVP